MFGTCAGLILLSKTIAEDETVHFGTLDVSVHKYFIDMVKENTFEGAS